MFSSGMHQLKSEIRIKVPVEACYQAWIDSPKFPAFAKRVKGVEVCAQSGQKATTVTESPEKVWVKIRHLKYEHLPFNEIKRWLFNGPGGKVYEVENEMDLEIPNRLYISVSADPKDIYAQSTVTFTPEENQNTLITWEISYWQFTPEGSWTQFASAIDKAKDTFMQDCLEDFKAYVETEAEERLQEC